MGHARHQREPFWATSIDRMTAAGQRLARGLDALTRRSPALAALLWIGSGWRTGGTEHPTGRALDYIAWAVGQRARTRNPNAWAAMNRVINEVLVPNARELGIRHIIWDKRIFRTRYNEWGALPGRNSNSSISDWHEDHAHIWLEPDGVGWLAKLDQVVLNASASTPTPAPAPTPTPGLPSTGAPGKSISQMAGEVIAGRHGNGHANRQRSLGIDAATYAQVRAEVNRRTGTTASAPKPAGKSIATMAQEVIDGRHGNGHTNRRRSLGVSASVYEQVRAEVNRRVSGGARPKAGKSVSQMATEVIQGKHGNGHATRRRSLGIDAATYAKVRAEVNRRV